MAEQPSPDDSPDDESSEADDAGEHAPDDADGATDHADGADHDEPADQSDDDWPPASRAEVFGDDDADEEGDESADVGTDEDGEADAPESDEDDEYVPGVSYYKSVTGHAPGEEPTEESEESETADGTDGAADGEEREHLGPEELDDPGEPTECDPDVDDAESLVQEDEAGELELADHITEQGVDALDEDESSADSSEGDDESGVDPLDDAPDPYEEMEDEPTYEANPGTATAAGSITPDGQPGATPAGAGGGGGGGYGAPGAPDDQEMPLGEHIEEMVRRLGVVIVVMALVSGVVFPFADRIINFLWYSFLPGSFQQCPVTGTNEIACPYLYHPLALMFARLKIAALAGFVIALPVMVYESYLFMRPGLYPRERRYYLASVPTSLVLAIVGVFFAYLLVLPVLFQYFTQYTNSAAEVAFGLSDTFNLIVMMLGFFSLIFQIPLFIMLAIMMGVTSRRWLASRRLYFYGGFATIAFVFSPDPTGMAPILVAVTMIVLFEGTLLLLKWTRESSPIPSAAALAARRPVVWALALVTGYLASSAPVPSGYYDSVPTAVTDALSAADLLALLPVFIGLALVALYELVALVARRRRVRYRVRWAIARGRAVAWPLAFVVGYFGSPDPTLIERIQDIALELPQVALLVVGIAIAFELFVGALALARRRRVR